MGLAYSSFLINVSSLPPTLYSDLEIIASIPDPRNAQIPHLWGRGGRVEWWGKEGRPLCKQLAQRLVEGKGRNPQAEDLPAVCAFYHPQLP